MTTDEMKDRMAGVAKDCSSRLSIILPSAWQWVEHWARRIEMISTEIRKARSEHVCNECSDPIMPGQHYIRAFGVEGGQPYVLTWHLLVDHAELS